MEKLYSIKNRTQRLSKTKQTKRKNLRLVSKRVIRDFINNTSIHGVKYLNDATTNGGPIVKLFWIFSLVFAFVGSGLLLRVFWERYQNDASMTVVDSFYVPAFNGFFPAMTVCSMIGPELAQREKILETLVLPTNMSKDEASYLLQNIFELTRATQHLYHERKMMHKILRLNGLDMSNFLKKVRGTCEDTVESCWWNEKKVSCDKFFEPVFASWGLCCSFNYKLENFLRQDRKGNSTRENILRTATYGVHSGLTLVFKENQFVTNHDNGTIARVGSVANTVGLLVYIHHFLEYPIYFTVILQGGLEMQMGVKDRGILKEPGIYRKGELPCVKDKEIKLDYFPFYGIRNCHNACRIRAALSICGCIPWQFSPFVKANQSPICNISQYICLRENFKKIWSVMFLNSTKSTCICPPRCRDESFVVRTAVIPLAASMSFAPSLIYRNITKKNSVLRVFTAQDTLARFSSLRMTNEIYMLSSVGGVFNLFLGCSILSLFEIAYFLFILIYSCYNVSQDQIQQQKGNVNFRYYD